MSGTTSGPADGLVNAGMVLDRDGLMVIGPMSPLSTRPLWDRRAGGDAEQALVVTTHSTPLLKLPRR